jgi:hypothetical protein
LLSPTAHRVIKPLPSRGHLTGAHPANVDDFRVSQLVRDYNLQQHGPDSPSAFLAGEPLQYLSDTELFVKSRNQFKTRAAPDSRGGGFRRKTKADDQAQAPGAAESREAGFKQQQKRER